MLERRKREEGVSEATHEQMTTRSSSLYIDFIAGGLVDLMVWETVGGWGWGWGWEVGGEMEVRDGRNTKTDLWY